MKTAIALGKLALAFGRTNRATFHEDGKRPETDTDHTVMLGLIACTHCPKRLDRGLVAQYVLVHDLVEAKCGDTNSFDMSEKARIEKDAREEAAFLELREEFGVDSWMIRKIIEYEWQESPEARYVRYLDKAMPKITHMLNQCAAIKRMRKSHADLVRAHEEQLTKLGEEYPEMDSEITQLLLNLMRASEEAYDIPRNPYR